jgi:hypothetical protein
MTGFRLARHLACCAKRPGLEPTRETIGGKAGGKRLGETDLQPQLQRTSPYLGELQFKLPLQILVILEPILMGPGKIGACRRSRVQQGFRPEVAP